ncbi:tenascin-R-like [Littorina saxatilis]|uniref:VIgL family fibrinogen-related protein 3 n=1 Tax=Littorina saxatilis TaxID=31220 RepID=A0AAN9APF6_9CAEN
MASTRFRMIGVGLFVVAFSALEAYQWDGGPEDKAKITACLGGNASFPWSIVTGLGETILGRDWWFQAPDKEKTSIATYQNNHFYATDNLGVGFLPNAGLSLGYARHQDSGNYSVRVQLHRAKSSLVSVWRTATLSVADRPPATQDGALHVTPNDAVRDDVTNDLTLELHCGQFVDLGHPPVDVVWKTPSGEVRNSSYRDNGTFVLSLSNPVQGGIYSCQLAPSAPAVRCLTATSPLNAAAKLNVDGKDTRLSLLEGRLREIEQVNKDQNGAIEELTETDNDVLRRIAANCVDWLKLDPRSGIRTVYISGDPITVYCDQITDNGGWIVFQRRQDASVDFYRDWADYRKGFGDLEGSFWLGLDALHSLTTSRRYQLRVDLKKWYGTRGYATYSGFYVEDSDKNFRLHFDNFTGGNAGDSLSWHRGLQFSTKDRDHDSWSTVNCAQKFHGAWWYKACDTSNLNGHYKTSGRISSRQGVTWDTFGGETFSMKFTEMKIRPI